MDELTKKITTIFFSISALIVGLFWAGSTYIKNYNDQTGQSGFSAFHALAADIGGIFQTSQGTSTSSNAIIAASSSNIFSDLFLPSSITSKSQGISNADLLSLATAGSPTSLSGVLPSEEQSYIADALIPSNGANDLDVATPSNIPDAFSPNQPSAADIANNGQSAAAVPVLLYHAIVTNPDGVHVTQAIFQDQMEAMKQAGWNTISIYDFEKFIQGQITLPPKSFLLTFDDGIKSSYVNTDPVLKELNYQAVMFTIVDRINKKGNYQLTDADLKEMVASGRWEIQSHSDRAHEVYSIDSNSSSTGHFLSNKFWIPDQGRFETDEEFTTRIQADLQNAKNILQNEYGQQIISFAFPFSDYGQDTVNFPGAENIVIPTVQSLYSLAFYQADLNTSPDLVFDYSDPGSFMEKRIEVSPSWTGPYLVDWLAASGVKYLPYSIASNNFDDVAWIPEWGQKSVTNGTLTFGAATSTNGGITFLNGSKTWSDYSFNANINWIKGNTFGMIARVQDARDFMYCDFGENSASIVERNGDKENVVVQNAYPASIDGGSGDFGVRVYGNKIACSVGGQDVTTAVIPDTNLSYGGVGFTSWDSSMNNSEVIVNSMQVTPLTSDDITVPLPVSQGGGQSSLAASSVHLSLPYQETNFSNDPNWEKSWGVLAVDQSNFLDIGANASTTGGGALLAGSSAWTNYIFTATLDWVKGQTLSLLARYNDNNDDVSCEFDNTGSIRIYRLSGGQQVVLGQGTAPSFSTLNDVTVSIQVNDGHVQCGLDSSIVPDYINWGMPPQLLQGGIGFDTWDPQANNSQIIVKQVSVTPL
jgi:peptidoglycan/xylan/chitin deacetylase (PgdA/CDA1 family)